jgi:hypothetical protein
MRPEWPQPSLLGEPTSIVSSTQTTVMAGSVPRMPGAAAQHTGVGSSQASVGPQTRVVARCETLRVPVMECLRTDGYGESLEARCQKVPAETRGETNLCDEDCYRSFSVAR